VRELRERDQDRERVDEPRHHRPRHEPHQLRDAEQPERHLNRSGEDRRREQILDAVVGDERDDDQRHRAGRRRDHRRPAARERDRHGHGERGVETDAGIDARDDRERDRLRDQRERDDQTGEQLDTEDAGRRRAQTVGQG
jgi:hypothetical protein